MCVVIQRDDRQLHIRCLQLLALLSAAGRRRERFAAACSAIDGRDLRVTGRGRC